jgi:hypothetical protein
VAGVAITVAIALAGIAFAWFLARALARPAARPGLADELMGDWPAVPNVVFPHDGTEK